MSRSVRNQRVGTLRADDGHLMQVREIMGEDWEPNDDLELGAAEQMWDRPVPLNRSIGAEPSTTLQGNQHYLLWVRMSVLSC